MHGHVREKEGRNEPCACGSGKKYKRCCLRKAEAEDALWQRVHAAFARVQSALSKFAGQKFGELAEFAWSDYHFGEPDESSPEDASSVDLFLPYFIYRWRPAKKRKLPTGDASIADAYLRLHGGELSELERQVVELGMTQAVTFYEVMSVAPGHEFLVKEVFTGKESRVQERSGSKNVRRGDILYGQLAPIPEITTMAFLAGFIIPPRMKPEIVALRRELQDDEDGRALKAKDILRSEDEVRELYFYIRDVLHAPPVLCNTDDEPLVLQTIKYQVGSPQVAFDALAPLAKGASREDLLQDAEYDAEGNLHKIAIQWIKKGNRKIKSWDNTVLGTIRICGRSVEADVNSEERAGGLRREIEQRLGLAAIYKGTEVIPVDLERMRKERTMPPARHETNELLKDPEAQKIMREMVQKQVDGWVRQKIPALGGRTPLQAVKDPDGREMVEALINDWERTIHTGFAEEVRPDLGVIRRLLKLPKN